jgi:hypothetical protein
MSRSKMKVVALSALVSALFAPLASSAAEADLAGRIEALSKEIEQLKAQVQANKVGAAADLKSVDDKSVGKWLTVGGDYQFRLDSLRGETKPFTDVNAMFSTAQSQVQAAFFANPTPATGGMLTAFMGFSQGMAGVRTFNEAQAFLGANAAMMGALGSYAAPAFVDSYKPKNSSLMSNRFGLDLKAQVAENVAVKARFSMYKNFGMQDGSAVTNGSSAPFFADRVGVFDGTLGRVPSSSLLNVDRAYATWSSIGGSDLWFSVGRRPSTDGSPLHLKANDELAGTAGVPSLLVNYAFDGISLGYYLPDNAIFQDGYAKFCYGRGFETGFDSPRGNSLSDTDMLGLALVPVDSEDLRVWLQWNRGTNIFDAPTMKGTYFGDTSPKINLGDIDWYGLGAMGKIKGLGAGELTWFADIGRSVTHPNANVSAQFGFQGLLTGSFFAPEAPSNKTGNAIFMGLRYDMPSGTKLGFEFNQGSKNWITFAPAAADMWTSKLGTRGDVYDLYMIQELSLDALATAKSKAFFRVGVQVYDFKYTGSNNWVGAPVKVSDMQGQMSALAPLSKAYDIYATFEVKF